MHHHFRAATPPAQRGKPLGPATRAADGQSAGVAGRDSLPVWPQLLPFPDSVLLHVLKNLPVFRWADFPVSLLSFVLSGSALRLVCLRHSRRRLRVTGNRSSSLLSMSVRSAFTSFRIPNGHGPCGAAFGRSRPDAGLPARAGSSLHSAARGAPSGRGQGRVR